MDYRNLNPEELNWWNRRAEDKTAFIYVDGNKVYLKK